MATSRLSGVFVPLVTNFAKQDFKICYESMKQNIVKYDKTAIAGYVVGGSNGECPYLTADEKVELVSFVKKTAAPGRPVIGTSTSESTSQCIQLTQSMRKAGADAVLVMPPFYFKRRMTEEALTEHYLKVAELGELPVVIYNMPVVTGIDISTDTLASLAKHPRIVAVKDSDVRKCANTVMKTKDQEFDVLVGSAGYLLAALLHGCSGGINGLAGLLPEQVSKVHQLYHKGELQTAAALQRSLCPPDSLLLAELGVPGLKHAMDLAGLKGGPPRPPMRPPPPSDQQRIKEVIKHFI